MTESPWQLASPKESYSKTYVKYTPFDCNNLQFTLDPLPSSGQHNFVTNIQNFNPCIRDTPEQHRTISESITRIYLKDKLMDRTHSFTLEDKLWLSRYVLCVETHWINNADLLASTVDTKSEEELKPLKDNVQRYEVISLTI